MGERVAVVADAHLGGPGGPAGPLVEQLRRLPDEGCGHLLLLGDLFQLWIGDRRYETDDIVQVVEALVALRRAGLRVDYIEGNRDFFIGRSPYAHAFDRVTNEVSLELGGVRYLAVHGDGLDRRDWKYRFWRALSKSTPSRLVAQNMPRRIAGAMAHGTEQRLSETNQRHKRFIPEDVLRELRCAATGRGLRRPAARSLPRGALPRSRRRHGLAGRRLVQQPADRVVG